MRLVGYSDRLSAAPGESVRFMVSCDHPSYRADLVRLIHGDESARGPGFKELVLDSELNGEYPGRTQTIHTGSYVIVDDHPLFRDIESFSLTVWIFPTTPGTGVQGLLTKWSEASNAGFGLYIDATGDLALWIGDGSDHVERVRTRTSLLGHAWSFAAATYDAASGRVLVYQEPVGHWPIETARSVADGTISIRPARLRGIPFLMAGHASGAAPGQLTVGAHFNGKLDRPCVFNRALTPAEVAALQAGGSPQNLGQALVAAWDFSTNIATDGVTDSSVNGLHGRTFNMPTRAVTGYNWTGAETDFRLAPEQYGAIHFHDDDLEDAGWESDFELTVPVDLRSGVYAARLRANGDEDYLPFVVRPPKGTASARIAVLAPTLHYVVYANFRDLDGAYKDRKKLPNADPNLHQKEYRYIGENIPPSMYDLHSDGSGTAYVSRLRPILNMRP